MDVRLKCMEARLKPMKVSKIYGSKTEVYGSKTEIYEGRYMEVSLGFAAKQMTQQLCACLVVKTTGARQRSEAVQSLY